MNQPRVDNVYIERMVDESPDLSYLGQYVDRPQDGAIDRQARGDMEAGEYRYWIPTISLEEHRQGLRKLGHGKHPAWVDARSYVLQDYARHEQACKGGWCMLGIRARADVSYDTGDNCRRLEWFTSGGLWGIESDGDDSTVAEIVRAELADLKSHLEAFNVDVSNFEELRGSAEVRDVA